ncbi:MAG: hypothetical protein QGG67_19510, partial [Gammaproteobacteria bacterium]|nr:hypothetical protein [Gammaproteobacteria bacterium]
MLKPLSQTLLLVSLAILATITQADDSTAQYMANEGLMVVHSSTNSFKKVSIKTDTYLHLTIPKPLIFGSLFGRIDFLVRNCG